MTMTHTSSHVPSAVALAAADPKEATTASLQSGISFYSDEIHPDSLMLMEEEFMRRGGDPEYNGLHSNWEPQSYDNMGF